MAYKKSTKFALAFVALLFTLIPIFVVLQITYEINHLSSYRPVRSLESIKTLVEQGVPKQSSRREVENWLQQNHFVAHFTSVVANELGQADPSLPELAGLDENELSGMIRVICDDFSTINEDNNTGAMSRLYFFFDKNNRYVGHLVMCA